MAKKQKRPRRRPPGRLGPKGEAMLRAVIEPRLAEGWCIEEKMHIDGNGVTALLKQDGSDKRNPKHLMLHIPASVVMRARDPDNAIRYQVEHWLQKWGIFKEGFVA